VSKWLGDQLTQQLGEHHPKNQGVSNLLSKYAVDVIASNLASPDLIKQYQDLMLGGDQ
jgi:hypothetical protein